METLRTRDTERMLDREDAVVINVLDAEKFEREHIPGTKNVPLTDENFIRRVETLAGGKDAPVLVYCAGPDCEASPKAARELEDAGFTEVYHFEGGMKEWKAAGKPVESAETVGAR